MPVATLPGTQASAEILQDYAEVPVAEAVSEEQKAAFAKVFEEDGGNGRVIHHAGKEIDVIFFRDYEGVPIGGLGHDGAVYFENERPYTDFGLKLIGALDRFGLFRAIRPPQDRLSAVLPFGGIYEQVIKF